MLWAMKDDNRIHAEPGLTGSCPGCGGDVIAKCGEIVVWHWAHKVNECDPWREPESEWHIGWKKKFPDDWQEVVIGDHRADVRTPVTVIELQSSDLSSEKIAEREAHYKNMVWMLNAKSWGENMEFKKKPDAKYHTFRWKWPRKSWWYANKPVFIDFGEASVPSIFLIKKCYKNIPCGGWGYWLNESQFMKAAGFHP